MIPKNRPTRNQPKPIIIRSDFLRGLQALSYVFREHELPEGDARFSQNRLLVNLEKYGVPRGHGLALIDQLIEDKVIRVGKIIYDLQICMSFDGEQVDSATPNPYLHTTRDIWFTYLSRHGIAGARLTASQRKRATRAFKIEAITRELNEHMESARDYAWSTKESTGVAELLPRPSQKYFADAAGLTPSDVSRCLGDDSARELKSLWRKANSLKEVMSFKSSRRKRRK